MGRRLYGRCAAAAVSSRHDVPSRRHDRTARSARERRSPRAAASRRRVALALCVVAVLSLVAPAQSHMEAAPMPVPFSSGKPGAGLPRGWEPVKLTDRKRPTAYTLVHDGDVVVLHANAVGAASGLAQFTPLRHPQRAHRRMALEGERADRRRGQPRRREGRFARPPDLRVRRRQVEPAAARAIDLLSHGKTLGPRAALRAAAVHLGRAKFRSAPSSSIRTRAASGCWSWRAAPAASGAGIRCRAICTTISAARSTRSRDCSPASAC